MEAVLTSVNSLPKNDPLQLKLLERTSGGACGTIYVLMNLDGERPVAIEADKLKPCDAVRASRSVL